MRPAFFTAFIVSSVASAALAASFSGDGFVSAVQRSSVAVDPGEKLSPAAERALEDLIRGRRVVYLGETSHFVQQKYDYRKVVLGYLLSHGFNYIGLEMGHSDGLRVNEFFQSGQGADLSKAAVYGYKADVSTNILDLLTGYLKWKSPQATQEYQAQDQIFLSWLQGTGKVRKFFGFDIDTLPGGGYSDIKKVLASNLTEPLVAEFLKLLDGENVGTVEVEKGRLNEASNFLKAHYNGLRLKLGEKTLTEVSSSLSCLVDSFQFASVVFPLPGSDPRVIQAMEIREHTMFRQMSDILTQLKPNEKIVLMGHSMHLSKDSSSAGFGPISRSAPMWPSIGSVLNNKLPGQVASIWMIQNEGSQNDISCATLTCPFPTTDSSYISYFLHQVSKKTFILNTAALEAKDSKFLDRQWNFVGNSSPVYNANLKKNVDMIFYVDRVNGIGE